MCRRSESTFATPRPKRARDANRRGLGRVTVRLGATMIIEKNGQRILTLDDWYRAAPPMSTRHHWVDDRSAKKEVARA